MNHIDSIDTKILDILQKNGRITNSQLASTVNLSTAATLERVKKLEIREIVKGYRAELSPKKIGLNFEFFLKVRLKSITKNNLILFSKSANRISYITTCYQVSGSGWHFIVFGATSDIAMYIEKVLFALHESSLIDKIEELVIVDKIKNEGYNINH